MAEIIHNEQKETVEDGSSIIEPCEKLGVTFSCKEGICGSCQVEVEEGMENLSEKTVEEEDMGCDGSDRLACQCKIKQGSVKIRF